MIRFFIAAALMAFIAEPTWSHSGGLNKDGCHNNRKTGDYHCHGGGNSWQGLASAGSSGKRKRRRR